MTSQRQRGSSTWLPHYKVVPFIIKQAKKHAVLLLCLTDLDIHFVEDTNLLLEDLSHCSIDTVQHAVRKKLFLVEV
jgi:hypothetical protein